PFAFCRLDHLEADAVLDRATGILVLQLQKQSTGAGIEARELDERRVPDQVEDRRRLAGLGLCIRPDRSSDSQMAYHTGECRRRAECSLPGGRVPAYI